MFIKLFCGQHFYSCSFPWVAEDLRNTIDPANGINIIVSSQKSFVVGSINLFFVSFTIEMIHNKIFTKLNSVQRINPISGARSSILFCRD